MWNRRMQDLRPEISGRTILLVLAPSQTDKKELMPCSYTGIQEGIVLLYPNEMFPAESRHAVKEMAIR